MIPNYFVITHLYSHFPDCTQNDFLNLFFKSGPNITFDCYVPRVFSVQTDPSLCTIYWRICGDCPIEHSVFSEALWITVWALLLISTMSRKLLGASGIIFLYSLCRRSLHHRGCCCSEFWRASWVPGWARAASIASTSGVLRAQPVWCHTRPLGT